VATRRYVFACIDADYGTQVDMVVVDVVVGPPPVGRPEVVEPANRLHLRRPLGCLGPARAGLDPGHKRPNDSPGWRLRAQVTAAMGVGRAFADVIVSDAELGDLCLIRRSGRGRQAASAPS
jgi:hypothetical protein